VGQDLVAQPRDVRVESYEGSLALIEQGLEVGERVVVDGQNGVVSRVGAQ